MGDLPEPKYATVERDSTPVMMKISNTIGRNFAKTKEFEQLQKLAQNPTNLTVGGERATIAVSEGVINTAVTVVYILIYL